MNKIKWLHQHIIDLDLFAAEQMESFVDDIQIFPAMFASEVNQIFACQAEYTATFYIERFPHKRADIRFLIASVCAFLIDHDGDNNNDSRQFSMNTEENDGETADIEFSLHFVEDILAEENPIGPLVFNGVNYQIL